MEHRPGGETKIILRQAEKLIAQEIALQPPAQRPQQAIINAAAYGISKRRVGGRKRPRRGAFAQVAGAEQGVRERPNSADRKGELWADQEVINRAVHVFPDVHATTY